MKYFNLAVCIALLVGILACGEERARIPKPRAYPRIDFPERKLISFQMEDCPLTFQYPDYMQVQRRENFFEEKPAHPCWFDLEATALGATIHWSYYDIGSADDFGDLVKDAFRIADQINQRANYMDEIRIANAHGVSGLLLEFSGSAASPLHFYLTDSTDHFLRASLYYQTKVVPDSLEPVIDFMREDIATMINTLKFQ